MQTLSKECQKLKFNAVCGHASLKILRKRTDNFNTGKDHTVAEILGHKRRDTGFAGGCDEQRIPLGEAFIAPPIQRQIESLLRRRDHRKYDGPVSRGSGGGRSRQHALANRGVGELAKGLKRHAADPGRHGVLKKRGTRSMLFRRAFIDGIKENVGVEGDARCSLFHHRLQVALMQGVAVPFVRPAVFGFTTGFYQGIQPAYSGFAARCNG